MTVWSLSPAFNELDVLEIRLAEQDGIVDVFVIAEATTTYAGTPKPLYVTDAVKAGRFDAWRDKLRIVVVDDAPTMTGWQQTGERERWARENHQRRALARGIDGMEPDDVVVLSDLDEIIRCEAIEWYAERGLSIMVQPELPIGVVYLNARWSFALPVIARILRGRDLLASDPEQVRMRRGVTLPVPVYGDDPLTHYGWHFAYLGGADAIREKVRQAAHPELERNEWLTDEWLAGVMRGERELFDRAGRDAHVFDPAFLPSHVVANIARFDHLVCDDEWQPLSAKRRVVSSARRRTAAPQQQA